MARRYRILSLEPIRANGALQCEIGFAVFSAAAEHGKKLAGL